MNWIALPAALWALFVAGCAPEGTAPAASDAKPADPKAGVAVAADPDKPWVGSYKARIDIPDSDKDNPGAQMAKSMADSMSLDLKADGTFAMSMLFPAEGTFKVSGEIVELRLTKVNGMTAAEMAKSSDKSVRVRNFDKPLRLKMEDGGKKLRPIDEKTGQPDKTLTFIRA